MRGLAKQHTSAVRPTVEEKIDRGEAGSERLRAALRIGRVVEFLERERDAGFGERRAVEIVARAAQADEQRVRAHGFAKIQHQLALRAADIELGAVDQWRADAEALAQKLEQRLVQVDEPLPALGVKLLQARRRGSEVRRRLVKPAPRAEQRSRSRPAGVSTRHE